MDLSRSTEGLEVPPAASQLMQSLRSIGYTTSAALADIVDNSIGAGATRIDIDFAHSPDAVLSILDNGRGMSREELLAAMRYGSRDPRETRTGTDLGRFGLGLKTASLSQCRRLTVATFKNGELSIAAWDVDDCERRNLWWLATPDRSAVPASMLDALTARSAGTLVVWQELDRLLGDGSTNAKKALDEAIASAADYLALTFHRFLGGDAPKIVISLNRSELKSMDPFLEGHPRGQMLHPEDFVVGGHPVSVSPFVLPYPSKLKPIELERAGGHDRLKTGHGFYIYRGGRLVVPGGWFRIVPTDDLIRLARIRVDVPVALDHIWKVDVRKAFAEPPAELRPHLKRIVGQAAGRSRKVYTHKGTPARDTTQVPVWQRQDLREGYATWRLNRHHPVVSAALRDGASASDVQTLIDLAEQLLPIHDIHIHLSNDLPVETPASSDDLEVLARRLLDAFAGDVGQRERLLDTLHLIEPFSRSPEKALETATKLRS